VLVLCTAYHDKCSNIPTVLARCLHVTGNTDTVTALLEGGAHVAASSEAGPPLLWAAGSSAAGAGIVQALLAVGADVNAHTAAGVTALFMAAASGGLLHVHLQSTNASRGIAVLHCRYLNTAVT
jgi:hypothetical protein